MGFTNSQSRIPKFRVSFLLICCLSYLIEKIRKKSEFRIRETIWGTAKIVEINSLKKTSTFWIDLVSITYRTIHLRRPHFLGGRGVPIADVWRLEGGRGLRNADVYNF